MNLRRIFLSFLILVAWAFCAWATVAPSDLRTGSAETLRAKAAELREPLAQSVFGRPLLLTAAEEDQRLTSDAYAILHHAFAGSELPLADPAEWCEVLMLPFNTKHCDVAREGGATVLTMYVGRKFSTPLDEAFRLAFRFQVLSRSRDYLHVMLSAQDGPFGTSDYLLHFELTPLDAERSFMHLSYAYSFGSGARFVMQTYLATVGRNKVGFSSQGVDASGKPAYIKGMRGVIERNTMRYYLAIEAFLGVRGQPREARTARMIEAYFDSLERFPRQLHEMERGEYVAMKQKEFQRMRSVSPVPRTASSLPSR